MPRGRRRWPAWWAPRGCSPTWSATFPPARLADRLSRRGLLVLADLLRAAAVLVVGIALWAGHTPSVVVLLAVGAVDTAVSAVAGPAGTASLRHLVSPDDIPRALVLDNNRRLALGLVGPLARWCPLPARARPAVPPRRDHLWRLAPADPVRAAPPRRQAAHRPRRRCVRTSRKGSASSSAPASSCCS